VFSAAMFMQEHGIDPGRESKLIYELHVYRVQHIDYEVQHIEESLPKSPFIKMYRMGIPIHIHRIVVVSPFESKQAARLFENSRAVVEI